MNKQWRTAFLLTDINKEDEYINVCSFMLINTLTIVNKLYLIVKCYQFIIPIEVFGTQNEMTDRDTLTI